MGELDGSKDVVRKAWSFLVQGSSSSQKLKLVRKILIVLNKSAVNVHPKVNDLRIELSDIQDHLSKDLNIYS